jgi:hypothetical protein
VTKAAPEASGWPRRWLHWKAGRGHTPRRQSGLKPVPWINGVHPAEDNNWLQFPPERSDKAYYHRVCVVCGEPMTGTIIFGVDDEDSHSTAGPGGHPRCLWLAVNTCPHLMEKGPAETVAWAYEGTGRGHTCPAVPDDEPYSSGSQVVDLDARPLTRDELRAWAKRDPFGTQESTEEEQT